MKQELIRKAQALLGDDAARDAHMDEHGLLALAVGLGHGEIQAPERATQSLSMQFAGPQKPDGKLAVVSVMLPLSDLMTFVAELAAFVESEVPTRVAL